MVCTAVEEDTDTVEEEDIVGFQACPTAPCLRPNQGRAQRRSTYENRKKTKNPPAITIAKKTQRAQLSQTVSQNLSPSA
ncbi:hypothetical protein PRK78_003544 [Emydomyces testavorans]|uniref:Uncharacterized protein n=1 Tax=Emydomyces testavorans TaxID=2070801 RepID=A0AAF0IIM5_9EURO|nr:hypothetical protein PRK78_003544 [Emydomyces testavorans]